METEKKNRANSEVKTLLAFLFLLAGGMLLWRSVRAVGLKGYYSDLASHLEYTLAFVSFLASGVFFANRARVGLGATLGFVLGVLPEIAISIAVLLAPSSATTSFSFLARLTNWFQAPGRLLGGWAGAMEARWAVGLVTPAAAQVAISLGILNIFNGAAWSSIGLLAEKALRIRRAQVAA